MRLTRTPKQWFVAALIMLPLPAMAEIPVIEKAIAQQNGTGWTFSVTLRHPDSGWDHYADGWEVLDENGNSLGFRKLVHPHENEQPFTRSLSGVQIPEGSKKVFIRAHCLVDGWGEPVYEIDLTD